jgi:hypothetical protein
VAPVDGIFKCGDEFVALPDDAAAAMIEVQMGK